ncbi:MAG: hypothetical protein H7332_15305 [Bdellovibrionales bacterium]|nr:hypothetical protein [Ramlibacter sp.]
MISPAQPTGAKPLTIARTKTQKVKDALEVAGAELVLTNEVLQEALPDEAKEDALVSRALEQNLEVESKVQQAADELTAVTKLLKAEEAHTEKLEKVIEGLVEANKK